MNYFVPFLGKEETADCFALNVFRLSCFYKFSVAQPHSSVGRSAVCDCGTFPDHTC